MFWLHPTYLLLLIAVPLVAALLIWAARKRKMALRQFADPVLAERLSEGISHRRRRWKGALLTAGLFFLVLALAGPRFGSQTRELTQEGVDLMVVLDVSESMLAEDVAPSRLARAKREIDMLVRELDGSRVGLVVFAGDALLHCPLTHDRAAFRTLLDIADPYVMPVQGTDFGAAIRTAARGLETTGQDAATSGPRTRVMLIVSDGEDHATDTRSALGQAQQAGIITYAAGVGEPSGAPIPVYREGRRAGFKQDREGNVVTTRLEERNLRSIATTGGYFRIDDAPGSLLQVRNALQRLDQTQYATELYEDYEERYQWPLALAPLFLAGERLVSEYRRRVAQPA